MTESSTGDPGGEGNHSRPVLADVIAYLEARRKRYICVCAKDERQATALTPRRREVEVILHDLKAGMHEGAGGEK